MVLHVACARLTWATWLCPSLRGSHGKRPFFPNDDKATVVGYQHWVHSKGSSSFTLASWKVELQLLARDGCNLNLVEVYIELLVPFMSKDPASHVKFWNTDSEKFCKMLIFQRNERTRKESAALSRAFTAHLFRSSSLC